MGLASLVDLRVRTPWKQGPVRAREDRLLFSYTEFAPHSVRDWPEIALSARRLRALWPHLPGAVGMTLYLQPLRLRGGSLSVWESEDALRGFVGLPLHVEIMRRFRDRGALRSFSWWERRGWPGHGGRGEIARSLAHGLGALEGRGAPVST